jgi:threonine/homoserine/homoserine lactone efflux protein
LPHDLVLDAVAKIAVLTLLIVVVNSAWLIFGAALSTLLRDPRKGRIANVLFAIMLVASVALTLAVH